MKKQLLKFIGRRITYPVVLMAVMAIFAVSCEEETSDFAPRSKAAEVTDAGNFTAPNANVPNKGALLNKGPAANRPGDQSIAAIAIGAGFTELVGALSYVDEELDAGLVDLFLNGTDQYTVFAPTNDAFLALYDALGVDEISNLDAGLVLDVLLYHVTEGRRASNSVVPPVKPRKIETLLGVYFSVDKDGMITAIGNTAYIVTPDISASNGIIHVIDAVILPIE
jgi:transforming growth factor-beta-induced protein